MLDEDADRPGKRGGVAASGGASGIDGVAERWDLIGVAAHWHEPAIPEVGVGCGEAEHARAGGEGADEDRGSLGTGAAWA